jgi:peptidyl-prolyl cis-trans isomerase B (cyclophilin B)
VPTNEQRRATAKRKLERQLERRAKQAKRRRVIVIAGGVIASVAVIAAVVTTVVISHKDQKNKAAASTTSAASSSAAASTSGAATPSASPLPAFQPSAALGANCEYPASQEAAAKAVKPPRTGKVPTEPATISASMSTSQGNLGLLLANNESPCTVNSFASLAGQKFFNDTKCHRLTTNPDLAVLQCGDPKGDGTGGPGYGFANEYPTDQYPPNDPKLQQAVIYPRGTMAMAHSKIPNSNGSQFFLVYKDSQLPPDYTVFGTIQADGLATLDKIAKGGVAGGGDDGAPAVDVTIKSIRLD